MTQIKKGLILVRKEDKRSKPQVVQVLTEDCENNFLIRLATLTGERKGIIMRKEAIPKFYRNLEEGEQICIYKKPGTLMDRLKSKHLRG